MAAFDLLGRRWMLRILWEMRRGSVRFSEFRDRIPEASPTTISQRLDELVAARIVNQGRSGYRLTKHGAGLLLALGPLELWAQSWGARVAEAGDQESRVNR
ncbi:winged helix-turn-helix transcriptional regulator [Gordonia araii]|nr:helix-turn-helix domain-containing protein [Gordonia araii]